MCGAAVTATHLHQCLNVRLSQHFNVHRPAPFVRLVVEVWVELAHLRQLVELKAIQQLLNVVGSTPGCHCLKAAAQKCSPRAHSGTTSDRTVSCMFSAANMVCGVTTYDMCQHANKTTKAAVLRHGVDGDEACDIQAAVAGWHAAWVLPHADLQQCDTLLLL